MKISVTRKLPGPAMERLKQAGDTWVWPHDRDMTREEIISNCSDADILVAMLAVKIDEDLMEKLPNLKMAANYAVGYNNIDVKAAHKRGIVITNTPGVLTAATADLTMALLLAAARRLVEGDRLVRREGFKGWSPDFHLGFDIQGKTLGIYGLGDIGAAVARRATPFGLKIIYHNRRPKPDLEKEIGAAYVEFNNLLSQSDFLSINVPLTDETYHRFTADEFARMKDTAILINTGRGPVVKESDLAEALKNGNIAGAALDVYEFEPKIDAGLYDLENVILCPHLGSATKEVRAGMARLVADNVEAFVKGQTPPYLVMEG